MPRSSALLLLFVWLAAAPGAAHEFDRTAWRTDGTTLTGGFAGFAPEGGFHFQLAGERQTLAAGELHRWGALRDPGRAAYVVLTDGGLLVGRTIALDRRRLTLESDVFDLVELPLATVRAICFHPPATPLARDRLLFELRDARPERDRILLDNGDLVEGGVVLPPARQGPPGLGDEMQHLDFAAAAGEVRLSLERVAAVVFTAALAEPPAPAAFWLGLSKGDLLPVARFAAEADELQLTLAGGAVLAIDAAFVVAATTYLETAAPVVLDLARTQSLGHKHLPYLDLEWPFQVDRGLDGGRLRSGGRLFTHGLAMHATSRLAYGFPAGYDRFQAELALEESAGRRGSVVYRVFLDDGAGGWRAAYASPIVRGGEPPRRVSLPLDGARRIALIVEAADHGDVLDRALWLHPRLVK